MLILCALTGCAWAALAEEPKSFRQGNYEYILLDDGSAEISLYLGKGGKVKIPDKLDGHPVTAIGDYVFSGYEITELTVPKGIKSIGTDAFNQCEKLSRVSLPAGLKTIGDRAFECCGALKSITIPDSVTEIGEMAFFMCCKLTSVKLSKNLQTIGNGAFMRCEKLASIAIPGKVTAINGNPFAYCYNLKKITVPAKHAYLEIKDGALLSKPDKRLICCPGALNKKTYTVPKGTLRIEAMAFCDCGQLREIKLPDTVKEIGDHAFTYCYNLQSISLPADLSEIGKNAFESCVSLKRIVIPGGVTAIRDRTFAHCKSLSAVILPDGLESIGAGAFSNTSLTSLTIPNNVSAILEDTFSGCEQLSAVVLPDGLESIDAGVFSNCIRLKELTLPNSVKEIGEDAFLLDDRLKLIVVKDSFAQRYCAENSLRYALANETAEAEKPAEYVKFGTYPQTASGKDKTPIEWLVLEKDGQKALLISRYSLDNKPYHTKSKNVTWETCSLRAWLNGEFLKKAFTEKEQEAILTTTVDNSKRQGYGSWGRNGEKDTQDKVFLLSYTEAVIYLDLAGPNESSVRARVSPTQYAIKKGAYYDDSLKSKTADGDYAGRWWLRSPGSQPKEAAYVFYTGCVSYWRVEAATSNAVRPALWVDLSSGFFPSL